MNNTQRSLFEIMAQVTTDYQDFFKLKDVYNELIMFKNKYYKEIEADRVMTETFALDLRYLLHELYYSDLNFTKGESQYET